MQGEVGEVSRIEAGRCSGIAAFQTRCLSRHPGSPKQELALQVEPEPEVHTGVQDLQQPLNTWKVFGF